MITPNRRWSLLAGAALAAVAVAGPTGAQVTPAPQAASVAAPAAPAVSDALVDGFRDPPQSARPRVWWHWLDGNVTTDGIARDFDWLRRIGIGGVQNFDVSMGMPQVVEKRIAYMTPAWKDAFRFTARSATEHDLELTIAASPGWSETGGPWVKPEDGMKKLVWSETLLSGGKRFKGMLAPPPNVTGPFQDVPFTDPLLGPGGPAGARPTHYADVGVFAYPVAAIADPAPATVVASDGGRIDAALLGDESLTTAVKLKPGTADRPGTLTLTYAQPRHVRSATLFIPHAVPPFGDPRFLPVLEAHDGAAWRTIARLPLSEVPTTVAFPAVTASRFRLVLGPNTAPARVGLGGAAPGAVQLSIFATPGPDDAIEIGALRLSEEPRLDRFEAKAGFSIAPDYYAIEGRGAGAAAAVRPEQVVDLTARMQPDGRLDWTPPAGRWRIVRMGYTLVGKTNHPATTEATGLEVDKYDDKAVERYIRTYLDTYRDAAGSDLIGARGVRALLTDSIEVGPSNWTPGMVAQFQRLRGYDPKPWMPVLTGAVIGSVSQSEAFLYDFRRTLADLVASEHYATLARVAHEQGLTIYGEALENERPSLGDDMAMRAHADVPMAALWTFGKDEPPRPTLLGDMKGAASVAHVYGQNIAAAESFTAAFSPWAFAPADLRRVADLEFVHGINRPIIHTSVHQPIEDRQPGLSLAIFGQYFNRHDSWADQAKPWVDYLARSSYLLQQGRYQADVAYFYGEEAPLTALYANGPLRDVPHAHGFDFVGADALLNKLEVDADGQIVSAGGMRYRLLQLGGSSGRMTLPTLRRIAALVEAGATVLGARPTGTPSLADDPAAFDALAARLWGGGATTAHGKGRVLVGSDADAALRAMGVAADFAHEGAVPADGMAFLHRRIDGGELYFVTNRTDKGGKLTLRFGASGQAPQLWDAATGTVTPLAYRIEDGLTLIERTMLPFDSAFILFRGPKAPPAREIATPATREVGRYGDGWTLDFVKGPAQPEARGAVALGDWSTAADARLRYFSGTARYRRSIGIDGKLLGPGRTLRLDLGRVGDIAEVFVNGKSAGTVWKAPYVMDIETFVKAGRNDIEIRVTNLWVNRLIGDAQPGAKPVTWTALPTYRPDAPLRPSGLIGPVVLTSLTGG